MDNFIEYRLVYTRLSALLIRFLTGSSYFHWVRYRVGIALVDKGKLTYVALQPDFRLSVYAGESGKQKEVEDGSIRGE